jgi:hypothetical protein
MNRIVLILLGLCCLLTAQAQQTKYSAKDYARNPVWIQMVDDTFANYFEAEKAYKTYWQHHAMPATEHDVIGEHAEREKIPSKREQKKIQRDNKMSMAVKKYERWRQRMLPYVQKDGSILTPSQRLKLSEAQKNK